MMDICCVQVVREKLFKRLYKEVPYRLDIKDAGLSIFRDGSIRIEKHVLVHSNQVKTVDICHPSHSFTAVAVLASDAMHRMAQIGLDMSKLLHACPAALCCSIAVA